MSRAPQPGLSVTVDAAALDAVGCRLELAGATAIEERDATTLSAAAGDQTLLIAGFTDPGPRDAAARALIELRRTTTGIGEICTHDVEDDGWSSRWREFFRPVVLTQLQVVTPWMTPPRADRTTLVIDPGLAFGTGGHATTRQVLALLELAAADGGLPPRVLDIGTGSGVLAIAAALLGAARIRAIDIDPDAVEAAAANARVNGVGDRVEAVRGGPEELANEWPLVLANLELPLFQRYAPEIAAAVAPGGVALISGLLVEQVPACRDCWPGFALEREVAEEGWAALALRRPR